VTALSMSSPTYSISHGSVALKATKAAGLPKMRCQMGDAGSICSNDNKMVSGFQGSHSRVSIRWWPAPIQATVLQAPLLVRAIAMHSVRLWLVVAQMQLRGHLHDGEAAARPQQPVRLLEDVCCCVCRQLVRDQAQRHQVG
jgi:hypothetical protein